jgi:hypothetical protein
MGKSKVQVTVLHAGKELQRFVQFFDAQGVVYTLWQDCRSRPVNKLGVLARCHVLTVAQAHFIFDYEGHYLGVEQDEMGGFDARVRPGG